MKRSSVVVWRLFSESLKFAVGVADFFGGNAHALHHADVEAGERRVVVGLEMTAGFELAVGTSGENNRDVFGGVGVSVTNS